MSSGDSKTNRDGKDLGPTYEEMNLEGQRFLCQIPRVDLGTRNQTEPKEPNEAEEKKELARATDRGLELLREMEGRCMYYVSGWWSYSLCYKRQIKQFHALPSGSGIPSYPPLEDPTTHSFILGKFPREMQIDDEPMHKKTSTDTAQLQTRGGSRYLVQRLEGGTTCDLTGRSRKIEIQFHCHPQSTDRIGWIKELTTCSYLMVVYTPRLCNDVAFLPPQQDEVHPIECREILSPDEVQDWESMREYQLSQRLVEAGDNFMDMPIVGDIEVGGKRLVGKDGRQIEKGRVASIGEEKKDVIARSKKGEVNWMSNADLKKYNIDPEKVETLRKRIEEVAQGQDWKLEVVDANGERGLRGIVDTGDDEGDDDGLGKTSSGDSDPAKGQGQPKHEDNQQQQQQQPAATGHGDGHDGDEPQGSEEIFKDEL